MSTSPDPGLAEVAIQFAEHDRIVAFWSSPLDAQRERHFHAVPPKIDRLPERERPSQVPIALGDGRFEVDGTWGRVQPAELASGVRTVGELEVIGHIGRGKPIVDTRLDHFFRQGTIPSARSVPHDDILSHRDELDPAVQTIFFCNGPQCPATADAVRRLLDSGYPPAAILYYRGGIHDWMTLGFPVVTQYEKAGDQQ